MAVQKEIRQFQTTGIVGDIVLAGPVRAQAGLLISDDASNNVIGRAMTHIAGTNNQFKVGGDGAFAGILANSKLYALIGTSEGALEPTMTLPNNTQVEGVTFTSGIMVALDGDGSIGDAIEFSQEDGTLKANSTGEASEGSTLINAKIVRFDATNGYAIIELTE